MSLDPKADALLDDGGRLLLARLADHLAAAGDGWEIAVLEDATRAFAEAEEIKLGKIAQPLRAALTGRSVSPPIFDVMTILGREEVMLRLRDRL